MVVLMLEIPGLISAPFDEDQIKSINRYQRDGRTSAITCSCGGEYVAKEDGMHCVKCFSVNEIVPKFTTNWIWNKFKYRDQE